MKKLIALLLALVMVLSLAACGTTNETPSNEPVADTPAPSAPVSDTPDNEPKEEITLHLHMSTSIKKHDLIQQIADKYYEETGIKVIVDASVGSSEYRTKNTLMIQDPNTAPDIVLEDGFLVKTDSSAGYLLNLDSYLAEWEDYAQFNESLAAAGQGVDGSMYALPVSTDCQVIWYNADVTEAAGLGRVWQPQSWQDVLDAANAMKKAYADDPDFIPMFLWASTAKVENASMRTFQVLNAGTGADLYDYESGQWIVDYAALKETLTFIDQAWNEDELCSLELASNTDADSVIATDLLPNGKVGMAFTGSTLTKTGLGGSLVDVWGPMVLDGTINYAYIPSQNGPDYVTMCGGWTWAIPTYAKNPDASWEFIKYMNQPEYLAEYSLDSSLPIRNDVWTSETWTNQTYVDLNAGFQKALEFAKFRDSVDGYNTVTGMYAALIENVAFGLMPVDEAIENFEIEMVASMGADLVKVINK